MDVVLGVLQSRRERDTVIWKKGRDEWQHKEKTGNAAVQEKHMSIFEGDGQEPQNRARNKEEKLDISLISCFFMHTIRLSANGWTGTLGGEGELEWESERERYLSWEWMEWGQMLITRGGGEAEEPTVIWLKNNDFKGCLCSVVCSQCNLFKDLLR